LENFEKLNEAEASTSDKPESYRVLRNRKVIISSDTPITKYNSLTFSYFTYIVLDSISIEIYKLSFVNYHFLFFIIRNKYPTKYINLEPTRRDLQNGVKILVKFFS